MLRGREKGKDRDIEERERERGKERERAPHPTTLPPTTSTWQEGGKGKPLQPSRKPCKKRGERPAF